MSGPISRAVMFVVNSRQDEQRHQAMGQGTLVLCSVVIQLQPTIETQKVLLMSPQICTVDFHKWWLTNLSFCTVRFHKLSAPHRKLLKGLFWWELRILSLARFHSLQAVISRHKHMPKLLYDSNVHLLSAGPVCFQSLDKIRNLHVGKSTN